MRKLSILIAVLFLDCLSLQAQTTPEPDAAPKTRLVHGLVLGLDGQPAPHRTVHLVGLSRGSARPYSDSPTLAHWDFTTDSRGRFVASFGDFGSWTDKENRPGWGSYALVVDNSPQDAGAVSPRFWFDGRSNQYNPTTDTRNKHEWGPTIDLPPTGLSLTLQIQSGITLKGRVWDYVHPDQPLAGIGISTNSDLHRESHTGYGGEIFNQNVTTDSDGRFTVSHIYPAKFHVGLSAGRTGMDGSSYWLKTKIADQWVEIADDNPVPKPGESVVHLELMGTRETTFRYFGKVAGENGQPLAGLKVTVGMSWHSKPETWADWHHFEYATTDQDGQYEIKMGTPWVRLLNAEVVGFPEKLVKDVDSASLEPGEYNFTLKKD